MLYDHFGFADDFVVETQSCLNGMNAITISTEKFSSNQILIHILRKIQPKLFVDPSKNNQVGLQVDPLLSEKKKKKLYIALNILKISMWQWFLCTESVIERDFNWHYWRQWQFIIKKIQNLSSTDPLNPDFPKISYISWVN